MVSRYVLANRTPGMSVEVEHVYLSSSHSGAYIWDLSSVGCLRNFMNRCEKVVSWGVGDPLTLIEVCDAAKRIPAGQGLDAGRGKRLREETEENLSVPAWRVCLTMRNSQERINCRLSGRILRLGFIVSAFQASPQLPKPPTRANPKRSRSQMLTGAGPARMAPPFTMASLKQGSSTAPSTMEMGVDVQSPQATLYTTTNTYNHPPGLEPGTPLVELQSLAIRVIISKNSPRESSDILIRWKRDRAQRR